jgi:CBS domain containing-hemolysin-like protein
MSESENLVLKILETIQADIAAMKGDVSDLKIDMREVKAELADFRSRVDIRFAGLEYRMTNIEGLLVENVNHTRVIAQVVKQHGHRLDVLDADKKPPPTP